MPFVQLQHSKDIFLQDSEYESLFKKIYSVLFSNLGSISSFKASVSISDYAFIILREKEHKSFIYLKISLQKKANRTEEIKNTIGEEVLAVLEEFFAEKLQRENINIHPSVEIVDTHYLFKKA